MVPYSTKKTTASTLPIDIIMEILSKLPVKSLLQMKTVCKSWHALIKDPKFIKLHLNQSLKMKSNKSDHHLIISNSSGLFSTKLEDDLRFSELHDHPLKHSTMSMKDTVHVFGTCHGILCISTSQRNSVVLYNPLTKTHRKLPNPLPVLCTPHINYICMALGFGYDNVADDYKVLSVFRTSRKAPHNAQVYSLKNNSWNWVQNFPFLHIYLSNGVLVNNDQHYLVTKDVNKTSDKIYVFIVSFDYHHETHLILDLPSAYKGDYFPSLGRLNEYLCVSYDLPNHYDCWIMKEYGKKDTWAKLFRVNKTNTVMNRSLLAFSSDGGKVLLKDGRFKWFWFDLKTKKVEDVQVYGLPYRFHSLCVDSFVGSLVSFGEEKCSQ